VVGALYPRCLPSGFDAALAVALGGSILSSSIVPIWLRSFFRSFERRSVVLSIKLYPKFWRKLWGSVNELYMVELHSRFGLYKILKPECGGYLLV